MKRLIACILILLLTAASCTGKTEGDTTTETTQPRASAASFSDRDYQTEYEDPVQISLSEGKADGEGVIFGENTITVAAGGAYRFTGSLTGQIRVEAPEDENVHLVLAGADVQAETTAAVYILTAKNVYITLEEGTENRLTSSGTFVQTDSNNVDGAVFSKTDLTINGSGALTVLCEEGHGVVTKDDLKITGGTIAVTASGQCINGKDSVSIADGTFTLNAGKDGIHSENADDTAKGNVILEGGSYTIFASGDGISASGTLSVLGGTYDILTGDGSSSVIRTDTEDFFGGMGGNRQDMGGRGGMQMPGGMTGTMEMPEGMTPGEMPEGMEMSEGMTPGEMPEGMEIPEGMTPGEMPEGMEMPDGMTSGEMPEGMEMPDGMTPGGMGGMQGEAGGWGENTAQTAGTESTASQKGLKADGSMVIENGTFTIDAADDAIHTNSDLHISGGIFTIASGDDGIHGDGHVEISGGTIEITASYEGIEGTTIDIAGGEITLNATDDGLNAAGGNDSSGFMGFFGGDTFGSDSDSGITISGGTLTMTAQGDGIDSNGYLHVTGGTTYVNGPVNSANGALDYASEGTVTGGTFVAVGAVGMAMNFGETSTQGAIMVQAGGSAGDTITLTNADGTVLAEYAPAVSYSSVVISAPGLTKGGTYTLTIGNQSTTIEMTDIIYGSSSGMGGMMGGGFGGNMGGNKGGGRGGRGG